METAGHPARQGAGGRSTGHLCKQEPSTLRGLLLGTGAFSGVCPHHRAEGSLPRLGLSLVFPQRKELRPRDGRGCPLSYGKHRLFPLSVEIGQASLPWV